MNQEEKELIKELFEGWSSDLYEYNSSKDTERLEQEMRKEIKRVFGLRV